MVGVSGIANGGLGTTGTARSYSLGVGAAGATQIPNLSVFGGSAGSPSLALGLSVGFGSASAFGTGSQAGYTNTTVSQSFVGNNLPEGTVFAGAGFLLPFSGTLGGGFYEGTAQAIGPAGPPGPT